MTLVEVLRAACCIAMLDQQLDHKEFVVIKKIAAEAGVGDASLNAMLDRAKRDDNFYKKQFDVLKADADDAMKKLFGVAVADRELEANELEVLKHFASVLGMDDARFDQLLQAAKKYAGDQPAS